MENTIQTTGLPWPLWRKIVFRFFFIYFTIYIAPWTWLDAIPGVSYVTDYYSRLMSWCVEFSNTHLFHVRDVLVEPNGSGDTSWAWAQLWMLLFISFVGCIIWSIADRNRTRYFQLNYWLCLFIRYYVSLVAFIYGIEKLFALQMPFPNMSQLATPLGDFLPMRLSWMFIGYSTPYQVFSGIMETAVGILLLYRRTATLGILMATAVFMNVMMLNLSYDIPVKLYSMHIVLLCIFLAVNEWNRIVCFFVLNRQAPACTIYYYPFPKRWMRITRIALKTLFIMIAVGWQFYTMIQYYKQMHPALVKQPVQDGFYAVNLFVRNNDTIAASHTDSLRWQDVIIEQNGFGSIKSADTAYRQRYKRAYFAYFTDSTTRTINFKKFPADSLFIASFRYETPDDRTLLLQGHQRNDSLYIVLKKTNRHFQLAEKQFHWLSEANR
jgi:hypothetical protein